MTDVGKRVVVGISGSTGAIYGIRLLEKLKALGFESHLVISAAAKRTLTEETDYTVKAVEGLAHAVYDDRDIGAAIASGSFHTEAMVVAPCSIKTVSALANSYAETLIARAGDVTLKEGRPLAVLVRESPLHLGHLRQLTALAEIGGIIMPPMPAFYPRPRSIDDIVDFSVARVIERMGLAHGLLPEWKGTGQHED